MKLVLADVEERALFAAAERLRASGRELIAVRCDVSHREEVERLAELAMNAFGAVHVVCNNAGVADTSGAAVWEASLEDWQWVVGVNLWGVVPGIRTFVPSCCGRRKATSANASRNLASCSTDRLDWMSSGLPGIALNSANTPS
jgi:NAD(P)-dependent dehydrogenase (short-subunit alcohol dehydrogenase family)